MPTLVCDSILGVLILEDWEVDLHMASGFPAGPLAMAWSLDSPDVSEIKATDEDVDAELLSLSNP